MIIKGKARARADQLTSHLLRHDHNERVEVRETRGTVATDLRGALREMAAHAAGARTTKPLYHAAISPASDRPLTPEQLKQAVDTLETALGFAGQARAIVVHRKLGREHIHVVWSRVDLDRGRAIPDSWNYMKHEQVARQLERAFGHDRVQGALAERDGQPRPRRTASLAEVTQAGRVGISRDEVAAELTRLWRESETGLEFRLRAEYAGYRLAQGDKRTFVVLDPAGVVHALARRIEGAKTKDIKAKLGDVQFGKLPTVEKARTIIRERLEELRRDMEKEQQFENAALEAFHAKEAANDEQRRARAAILDVLLGKIRARLDSQLSATLYSSPDYVSMSTSARRHMSDKVRKAEGYRRGVAARYWSATVPGIKAKSRKREAEALEQAHARERKPLDAAEARPKPADKHGAPSGRDRRGPGRQR